MGILEIILIAISLAMDAFAVSVANGVMISKVKISHGIKFGAFCGGFQFIMPLIGWLIGKSFIGYIAAIDHWIAFVLLSFIGANMLAEGFKAEHEQGRILADKQILGIRNMMLLALATSIDALAVGVSFAVIETNIIISSVIIGITAFGFSYLGVMLGKQLSKMFRRGAVLFGGGILIFIGVKILLEHLIAH